MTLELAAEVLVPILVALIVAGPAWAALELRRLRRRNTADHGTVVARLSRLERLVVLLVRHVHPSALEELAAEELEELEELELEELHGRQHDRRRDRSRPLPIL